MPRARNAFSPFNSWLPTKARRDQRGTSSDNTPLSSLSPSCKLQQHFSQAQHCLSVLSLWGSGSSITEKTRFTFCPCSFTDSNDLWQHRQEPSPQVAGVTDAQSPGNNSSRSKSTIRAPRSSPGDTGHGWPQAEAQVIQGICLHSLSFIKIPLVGCRGENQGCICSNGRDHIIICSLHAQGSHVSLVLNTCFISFILSSQFFPLKAAHCVFLTLSPSPLP